VSARAFAAGLLVASALAGCGGGRDQPTPEPAPPPPSPRETVDRLPTLPEGWKRELNRAGGFAFGVPPGWEVEGRGRGSLVRSFDRLVALSIVADRGPEALEVEVRDSARRAAAALRGYRQPPRVQTVLPFEHRYEGAEARALATARAGVDQRVSVIVLRRDRVTTLTTVLAANAEREAGPSRRLALRVVETLRTRPPRAGVADDER
jgi:hypothetical protein